MRREFSASLVASAWKRLHFTAGLQPAQIEGLVADAQSAGFLRDALPLDRLFSGKPWTLQQELAVTPSAKLAVKEVSKTFRTDRGSVHALDHVTLNVSEGEFVCLVGRAAAASRPCSISSRAWRRPMRAGC